MTGPITNASQARTIVARWLRKVTFGLPVELGLPEMDNRRHVWRVALTRTGAGERIGEMVIDAKTGKILSMLSTNPKTIKVRMQMQGKQETRKFPQKYIMSNLKSSIILGDAESELRNLPAQSVDLIFTSPPYYNARPQYSEFTTYEDYLDKMQGIIQAGHYALNEGRFFVMNISPVLIRRTRRSESSRRLAVPFDMHRLFIESGFDFVDDIVWMKPEGSGWATSRGRRFAADRNPLQYKAVPVTEYVLVYRKHSDRLIDWNIRTYPNRGSIQESKIEDGYERTNVWRITPESSKDHPAVFPEKLAENVIRYYSFVGDVVCDPFAGSGTVGVVADRLKRRYVLIDKEPEYIELMRERLGCAK